MGLLTSFLGILLGTASAAETPVVSPSTTDAFEWVSSLGYFKVKGLAPVEVWTGGTSQSHTRRIDPVISPAFLVSAKDGQFTILTLALQERSYAETEKRPGAPTWVHFEPRTLDDLAARFLNPQSENDHSVIGNDGLKPGEATTMFLLGWCCWQQGRNDLANRLVEKAIQLLPADDRDRVAKQSLREVIAPRIVDHLFNFELLKFADPKLTRRDLLDRMLAFSEKFSNFEAGRKAAQLTSGLESLLAEERHPPVNDPGDLSKLSPTEQARVLVWRLRDQNPNPDDPKSYPSDALLKLGDAAVPALIEVVDDNRPSRNAFFSNFGRRSAGASLPSIGDLASRALANIAHEPFYYGSSSDIYGQANSQPSELRRKIETWWKNYQSKGRRQFLIDGITAGGPESVEKAARLLREYPIYAGPVAVSVYAAMDSINRYNLIHTMKTLRYPPWTALLKHEVREGSSLQIRAAAAGNLREMGDSADEEMLIEWQKLLGLPHGDESSGIIEYLAGSEDESLIDALTKDSRQRPVYDRLEIISDLSKAYERSGKDRNQVMPTRVQAKIERRLVDCLDDDEEAMGWHGIGYHDPTVGDMAAQALTGILREKYQFDLGASWEERASARTRLANRWREDAGLDPLAITSPEPVPDKDRNKITQVIFADKNLDGTATERTFEELKGRTLSPDDLARILSEFGEHLPKGVNGLRFRAVRTAQAHGVTLKIWSAAGRPPKTFRELNWGSSVDYDGESITYADFGPTEHWTSFADALGKALARSANTELLVRAGVWFDK